MQKIQKAFALLTMISASICSLPSLAQDEAPKSFRIVNIRSNGSACPPGSVALNIADDQASFTLSFSQFTAEIGPEIARQRDRKHCKIVFDTEQDTAWEYAVMGVTFRGFASLDPGVKGSQELRFGRASMGESASKMELIGPYVDDYINSQEVPASSLRWSGCRANKINDFRIESVIAVEGIDRLNRGLFSVDTIDGQIRQEYELLWRPCASRGSDSRRSFAVCRLRVAHAGKNFARTLLSKGVGRSEALALSRARTKMANKCSTLSSNLPNCEANQAVCSSLRP